MPAFTRSSPSKADQPSLSSRLGPTRDKASHSDDLRHEISQKRATDERRRRSRSTERHRKTSQSDFRRRSASPRFENLKITADAKKPSSRSAKEVENLPEFRGPELGPLSRKEFKKIQIEIRRNLPQKSSRRSPLRRTVADPERLVVPRRQGSPDLSPIDLILILNLKDRQC